MLAVLWLVLAGLSSGVLPPSVLPLEVLSPGALTSGVLSSEALPSEALSSEDLSPGNTRKLKINAKITSNPKAKTPARMKDFLLNVKGRNLNQKSNETPFVVRECLPYLQRELEELQIDWLLPSRSLLEYLPLEDLPLEDLPLGDLRCEPN